LCVWSFRPWKIRQQNRKRQSRERIGSDLMRTCHVLILLLPLCGCNPWDVTWDPVLNERTIPESEIPEVVKAAVSAAKPNGQIVSAVAVELGRDLELEEYSVVVKDEDGRQWLLDVSPAGKVMVSMCLDEDAEDAEQEQ